jgi:hypothetical protein
MADLWDMGTVGVAHWGVRCLNENSRGWLRQRRSDIQINEIGECVRGSLPGEVVRVIVHNSRRL